MGETTCKNLYKKMLAFLLFVLNIHHSYADDAVQGSTINLTCTSSGPKFSWNIETPTKWSYLSNDDKYGGVDTSQLTIRNIDVTDSRNYLCYGGTYVQISLNVIVYAERGSIVVWTCPFSGSSYQWQQYAQNSWTALINDGKYVNVTTSQITIVNVDVSDNGQYRCSVDKTITSQSMILNTTVNGQWGIWGSWTTCSVTCGDGTMTRYRDCNNPVPANGGSNCIGLNYDTGLCYYRSCPVNGGWSTWGYWTTCNMTCGGGIWTRQRYCNNPAPSNGGSDCQELNYEAAPCNSRPCLAQVESSSIIGAVAGGVSGGIVVVALVVVIVLIFIKRKWTSNRHNHDYETRDMAKVELHPYDETKRSNRSNNTEKKSPVHDNIPKELICQEIDKVATFTKYNVRDFMRILQDKSLLSKQIRNEYQVLKDKPILRTASDYEIVDIKSGAEISKECSNKALVKKQDDGSGYIITAVPDQNDIDDFWNLISKNRVACIVLLSNETEKIPEFFPQTIVPVITHSFKVEICSLEKCYNNIFEFVLDILNKEEKTEVQVKLYKTTGWKDGEKHPSIDTMCKLLDKISSEEPRMVALVGSNGIGFSVCGDLGACNEVLYAITNEKEFNIFQIVAGIKEIRPDLFQTFEEYNLCYNVIGHFLQNEHTYAVIDENV